MTGLTIRTSGPHFCIWINFKDWNIETCKKKNKWGNLAKVWVHNWWTFIDCSSFYSNHYSSLISVFIQKRIACLTPSRCTTKHVKLKSFEQYLFLPQFVYQKLSGKNFLSDFCMFETIPFPFCLLPHQLYLTLKNWSQKKILICSDITIMSFKHSL